MNSRPAYTKNKSEINKELSTVVTLVCFRTLELNPPKDFVLTVLGIRPRGTLPLKYISLFEAVSHQVDQASIELAVPLLQPLEYLGLELCTTMRSCNWILTLII